VRRNATGKERDEGEVRQHEKKVMREKKCNRKRKR
jgi:hypothetical protein